MTSRLSEIDDETSAELSPPDHGPDIEFCRPTLAGGEVDLITQVVNSGELAAGGAFTTKAEALLSAWHDDAAVLLTNSCTSALELAAMTLGLGPDDVVAVPSFTFPTTVSAFVRTGAKVRFVDIDPVTLGMDPKALARVLNEQVTAVVPVHYGGAPCDIDGVLGVALEVGAATIEDNANGAFSTLGDRPLGTFGRMSALSFHQTKSLTCGQGGALVLNDARDLERAEILADKGTDRRRFLRGERSAYTWQLTGSAFGLGEVQAAHLLAQLQHREHIMATRAALWESYRSALAPQADRLGLTLPHDLGTGSARHGFHVLIDDSFPAGESRRDRTLRDLSSAGIGAAFHYQPLHRSPAGLASADRPTDCPVTDRVADQILRLPFHNGLNITDVERVSQTLIEVLAR